MAIQTDPEILKAISRVSHGNSTVANRIHSAPTGCELDYVLKLAFRHSNEQVLYWGNELISRHSL